MEHPPDLDNAAREVVLASAPVDGDGNLCELDHQQNDDGSSGYDLRNRRPSTAVVVPVLDWRASRLSQLHGPGFEVGASYEVSFLQQIKSREWKNSTRGPPTQVWLPPVHVSS